MFTACSAIIMSCASLSLSLSISLCLFLFPVTINNHSVAVVVAFVVSYSDSGADLELEAHNRCPIQPRNGLVQLSIGRAVKSENSGWWMSGRREEEEESEGDCRGEKWGKPIQTTTANYSTWVRKLHGARKVSQVKTFLQLLVRRLLRQYLDFDLNIWCILVLDNVSSEWKSFSFLFGNIVIACVKMSLKCRRQSNHWRYHLKLIELCHQ